MGLLAGATLGYYELTSPAVQPNCVIGQTFGNHLTPEGQKVPGPVNHALAAFVTKAGVDTLPLLLQREIAKPFMELGGRDPDLVINEHRKEGEYLDSWECLEQAGEFMREWMKKRCEDGTPEEPIRPLIVAQAFHAGRVGAQALKQGMEPVLWPDLPRTFNPHSTQWWTRSAPAWAAREVAGIAPVVGILRLHGKL